MSKREQKKEELLLAGMDVMWRCGYNGTSVKDIVDAAGVPKGSFYNYFESKVDFAIKAVEYASEQGTIKAKALLEDNTIPPLERIRRYFSVAADAICESEYKGGCFLGNMCQEMADTSDAIRLVVNQKLKSNCVMISNVIAQAIESGDTNNALEPKQAAEFIFNAWEGAIMRAKASQSREPLDAFLSMLPVIF